MPCPRLLQGGHGLGQQVLGLERPPGVPEALGVPRLDPGSAPCPRRQCAAPRPCPAWATGLSSDQLRSRPAARASWGVASRAASSPPTRARPAASSMASGSRPIARTGASASTGSTRPPPGGGTAPRRPLRGGAPPAAPPGPPGGAPRCSRTPPPAAGPGPASCSPARPWAPPGGLRHRGPAAEPPAWRGRGRCGPPTPRRPFPTAPAPRPPRGSARDAPRLPSDPPARSPASHRPPPPPAGSSPPLPAPSPAPCRAPRGAGPGPPAPVAAPTKPGRPDGAWDSVSDRVGRRSDPPGRAFAIHSAGLGPSAWARSDRRACSSAWAGTGRASGSVRMAAETTEPKPDR